MQLLPYKPIKAPKGNEPESPMKTSAGWELNHKKCYYDPQIALPIITSSPVVWIFGNNKYVENTACPVT